MKIFITTIMVTSSLYGFATADPGGGDSTSKLQRVDGSIIHYYLESSSYPESDTLLIAFQGSDCNGVKHDGFIQKFPKSLWPSTDVLLIEKPGITSSLRYDSSAERVDCPGYYLETDSPAQRVQDANAVVIKVRKDRRYRNIIAMGGSEGAIVAAMFAAESGIPNALVLINGGGRWFLEDVLHSIKSTTPEHQLSAELEGFKDFADHLLKTERFDIEVSNHGYAWWRSALTIDQKSVLNQIKVPTLVVQGGRDESVSPKAVTEMVEELRNEGKANIELVVYPEMDHGLFAQNGQQMTQEVSEDIVSWLKASLQPGPNKSMPPTADAWAD